MTRDLNEVKKLAMQIWGEKHSRQRDQQMSKPWVETQQRSQCGRQRVCERKEREKSGFIPSVAGKKPEVNHWGNPPMLRVLAYEESGQAHSKATLLSKTLVWVLSVESVSCRHLKRSVVEVVSRM